MLATFHVVIYTCVVTHFVGLKATQLALHSDFDTQSFSKAAASVMTTLVGSESQLRVQFHVLRYRSRRDSNDI